MGFPFKRLYGAILRRGAGQNRRPLEFAARRAGSGRAPFDGGLFFQPRRMEDEIGHLLVDLRCRGFAGWPMPSRRRQKSGVPRRAWMSRGRCGRRCRPASADAARRQVEIVVDDQHFLRPDLVEIGQGGTDLPRAVHEGGRLSSQRSPLRPAPKEFPGGGFRPSLPATWSTNQNPETKTGGWLQYSGQGCRDRR